MYGKTGEQSLASGGSGPVRLATDGSLMVIGGLQAAALAGRLFQVSNQAHITTTAALATTWTGLGVGNPATSGKLYVFHEFGWAQEVAMNTEGSYGLMYATVGDMAQAITPVCCRIGHATSAALCDNGATIGTPVLIRNFGSSMEGAISTVPSLGGNIYKLDGSIVIPPGYALLTYTFAIQTNSVLFHFVWEEIDS